MSIGSQVSDAMRKLSQAQFEDAIISTSIALCATARLNYPEDGDKAACRQFLEKNLSIIAKIGWVSFGVANPISFRYRRLDKRSPGICVSTMPEMLYDVVRCTAVHEAGLPQNLIFTTLPMIETGLDGELVLPIDLIYGLLIAIIASPKNKDEIAPENPRFAFKGKAIHVNELWGNHRKVLAFLDIA